MQYDYDISRLSCDEATESEQRPFMTNQVRLTNKNKKGKFKKETGYDTQKLRYYRQKVFAEDDKRK